MFEYDHHDTHKYGMYIDEPQESRWASTDEIKRTGERIRLSDDKYPAAGLPLYVQQDNLYVDNSDTHSLIFGTTGSKKTRLFILPLLGTLIKKGESFVATDPKGELYDRTSELAAREGYRIRVINFRDIGKGDRWNPLSVPYDFYTSGNEAKKQQAISMMNDVSHFLAGENEKDPFWPMSTRVYLSACMQFIAAAGKREECHVASLTRFCSEKSADIIKAFTKGMDPSSLVVANFEPIVESTKGTRANIMVSAFAYLSAFTSNEALMYMLGDSSFDLERTAREKTALYLIIPDEKDTYHFLAAMFIKQLYEILIGAAADSGGKLPIRVNFVLDEFCNMPEIPQMASMISAGRSRDIRFYIVAQSLLQLRRRYKEDADTIMGNCENLVFLTSRELELLRNISELCGKKAEDKPLISVSQLQRLDKKKGETLLLCRRNYPIISYMRDIDDYAAFKAGPPIPMTENEIEKVPLFLLTEFAAKVLDHKARLPFCNVMFLPEDVRSGIRNALIGLL